MIFVILGTQHNSFVRLLNEIERLINDGKINEKVIVQNGSTEYNSEKMELHNFISQEEFDKYVHEADLIITHGGVSSIVAPVKLGKTVIAIPRLAKYGEHVNDHQRQIIETFSKQGLIIGVDEVEELADAILKAKTFKPNKLESNTDNIVRIIEDFIDKL